MDVLEPGILFELRMELLLLAAMISLYMFTTWHTGGKFRQISKDPLGRIDSPDKYDRGSHSLSVDRSSPGSETSMERTSEQQARLCMIMDEIMDVGLQNFNCKGKEHEELRRGKLPSKLGSFSKNGSKFEVDTTKGAADHNLQLFDEFCGLLDRDGLTVVEIARITKHNGLDFYNTMVQSCVKIGKKTQSGRNPDSPCESQHTPECWLLRGRAEAACWHSLGQRGTARLSYSDLRRR